MAQYSFKNDYSEAAHPNILKALSHTNLNQEEGYGEDSYCNEAIKVIRKKIQNPNADIHFVSGGTQANLIIISSILRPYESVIAANTGHIAVHEAGAIEATGHKINTVETKNGKLNPQNIKSVIDFHQDEHMVKPKMVFISNSTEVGSIYKKKELQALSLFCKQNNLFLHLDGARLGSALTSDDNDLTLSELSKLVDIFYIGETKNGALLGEIIVINNDKLKENFRFHLKQKGALLEKERIFGIQTLELFKNDLFFELGKYANSMTLKLAKAIEKLGYKFLTKPVSNQIFPILPNKLIEKLSKKYEFYIWTKAGHEKSVIRLVTSWATKEEFVNKFISDLE
jgi:threonine aldolase